METLQRSGQLDPAPFFALDPFWQEAHLEHTRHHITGRYVAEAPKTSSSHPAQAMAAVEEWRRTRKDGPTARDIQGARDLLAMKGLPEALYQAARETLSQAEAA